jgi:glycosyltransferase involved in cell wall biosynthesis
MQPLQEHMRPSILIIGSFLDTAPLDRYVSGDLAQRLSARGWRVSITSRKCNKMLRLCDMLRTTWIRRNDYPVAQVDVFSGPAFFWAEAVCCVLRRLHKPYVLTLHGGNLPEFSRRCPRRVLALLKSATAVTTPSRYLQEQMAPFRQNLHLVPNPLDVRAYPFELREHPKPRLVWLRAFHEIYNPTLVPRIAAELEPEFPDLTVTMVGPDKHDGSLQRTQALAEDLGVAARISYPGLVGKAEVPDYLKRGDIFLNTAVVDNTPVSLLEAMACGLCVVSTRVGGIPYLVDDGSEALLAWPIDSKRMAHSVRRILREPKLAQRLSQNARHKAEQYDWSVVYSLWENLLTSVANGRVGVKADSLGRPTKECHA